MNTTNEYCLDSNRWKLLQRRLSGQTLNGHALLAKSLRNNGITHVYGISGTPVDEVLGACVAEGLRVIGTRHQQGAILSSVAHNYVTGRLSAAVIVSAGPAVTNCATGLLVAKDNAWPVIVIGGRRPLSQLGQGAFQELDGVTLFHSITKASVLVSCVKEIEPAIYQACQLALKGRPGPVYLDIAEEALNGKTDSRSRFLKSGQHISPNDGEQILKAAKLVAHAKRPALIYGKGLRWSAPWHELSQLVDENQIPFAASPMGRGFLPDRHSMNFTVVRSAMLAAADVVIVLGTKLDWVFRYAAEINPHARVIRIDMELPEDNQTFVQTVGIYSDIKLSLQALNACLTEVNSIVPSPDRDSHWIAELEGRRNDRKHKVDSLAQNSQLPMTPLHWLNEIKDFLPQETVTILDGNICMTAAEAVLPAESPVSRLTPGKNGCMGVGVPFSIGVKLACPQKPVVAICGDFALGLNMMELETAVRYRIPIVILVANNSGSCGATRQRAYYPDEHSDRVCQFHENVRHDRIMEAVGGVGIRVERVEHLSSAISQALECGKPALIDVVTDPDFVPFCSEPGVDSSKMTFSEKADESN